MVKSLTCCDAFVRVHAQHPPDELLDRVSDCIPLRTMELLDRGEERRGRRGKRGRRKRRGGKKGEEGGGEGRRERGGNKDTEKVKEGDVMKHEVRSELSDYT